VGVSGHKKLGSNDDILKGDGNQLLGEMAQTDA
jgi:hypothetical protein